MNATTDRVRIPWTRLSYLPAPEEGGLGRADIPGSLCPLESLRDVGALVLMAERGSGKSDVLRAEADSLHASGLLTYRLDLGEIVEEADVAAVIAERAPPPATADPWYVLIDSYDEALATVSRPHLVLDRWLKSLAPPAREALRLRVATRPGLVVAGAPLRQVLTRYWTPGDIQFRELARLNDGEIATAAQHYGVDPAAFVSEIVRRGLHSLVSLPVTLLELLEDAAAGRDLPATATQAYERGCDRWCHETNDERTPPGDADVRDLLAAAERAAAALHLCTTIPVLTDGARAEHGLRVSDLAEGAEAGPRITETTLRGLMSTGLMAWIDDRSGRFAMRSVQEFLASRFLRRHNVPATTLQTLLMAGHGESRHAVTAVRDLAGWVSTWCDAVFDDLLAHDPYVLLASDLAARAKPDVDRVRLVDALLTQVDQTPNVSLTPVGSLLYRLDHPGLAQQLAPHLVTPSAEDAYPRLGAALLIAQAAAPEHRPVQALLGLAESDQLRARWRSSALHLLPPDLDPSQTARLRALTRDPEEAVAAAAVEILWPAHLDLAALLDLCDLIPASRLPLLLQEPPSPIDTLEVLAWARRRLTAAAAPQAGGPPTDATSSSVLHAAHALAWALGRAEDDATEGRQDPRAEAAIAEALAALADFRDVHDYTASTEFPAHLLDMVDDQALRRRLAQLLLDRIAATDIYHLLDGPFAFFPPQDRIHWAEQFTATPAPAQDALALVLGRGLDRALTAMETAHLQEVAQADLRLQRLLEPWFSPQPNPRAESDERRQQQQRDYRAFNPAPLQAGLNLRPTGDRLRPWWAEMSRLVGFRTPDGSPLGPGLTHFSDVLDLTATPCWPEPDDPLHAELVEAAVWALETAPAVQPDHVNKVAGFVLDDVPELRALTALTAIPDLPEDRWAGLAAALMCIQVRPHDQDSRRSQLKAALDAAGSAFPAVLPDYLDRLPEYVAEPAVTLLITIDAALAETAANWAAGDQGSHPQRLAVLRPLAAAGDQRSLATTRADLAAVSLDGSHETAERWTELANILLVHGTDDERTRLWERLLADRVLVHAWAAASLTDALSSATPGQIGGLYEQLVATGDIVAATSFTARTGPTHPGIDAGMTLAAIPNALAGRSPTAESFAELTRLARAFPSHPRLPALARLHGQALAETHWERPTWPTLHALAADPDHRVVHDAPQLAQIVLAALSDIQHQITGPNGLVPLLWNRTADLDKSPTPKAGQKPPTPPQWLRWPKWEQDLSDLVLHLLQLRLAGHRLIINREVQIDRFGRTDIQIEANHRWDHSAGKATVIIETKGCWNSGVANAARVQLADHYLSRDNAASGIYLIGFFDSDRYWIHKRPGGDGKPQNDRPHTAHTIETLTDEQEALSTRLRAETGADIHAFVLDCRPNPIQDGVRTGTRQG